MTHICVSKLTIIGSDNALSPGRRLAIIWTNAGVLLIRTLGTHFSEILSEIRAFSFKKMDLKMSSAKWRRFCFGLKVLMSSPDLKGPFFEIQNQLTNFRGSGIHWLLRQNFTRAPLDFQGPVALTSGPQEPWMGTQIQISNSTKNVYQEPCNLSSCRLGIFACPNVV